MAFQNYADLQNAVSSWLNREDQETLNRIPDFIVFGENRIFRQLRTRYNETSTLFDSQVLDNTESIQLPADFKEVKSVQYDDRMLERRSDQYYLTRDPTAAAGIPLYFARIGNELKFWRKSDQNSDVILTYYNQQAHIDDNTIPALYLQFPELYLFGALLEAYPFLKHQDQSPLWEAKYNDVLANLMDDSWGAEYAGSTMSVSSPYTDSTIRTADEHQDFVR